MAVIKELLVLFIIGISAFAASTKCPSREDMPQCRCEKGAFNSLILECGDTFPGMKPKFPGMTIQDYIKVFRENKIAENKNLKIVFKNLAANSRIPSRIFEGFHIKDLHISYSENITMLADEEGGPAFVGLENSLEDFRSFSGITVPRKYDNYQQEKAPASLGHLRKLRIVEFTYNDINTFANGWFDKGPSSLIILKLNLCKIRYFGDRAFAGLTNLKKVELRHNEFESLSRSMFPNPANHLWKMDFSYSKLKYFSEDFFTNMPALTDVFLSGNPITHLPENPWRPVWSQLIHLDLTFTRLNCDDHIRWMFNERPPKHMWAMCRAPEKMDGVDLKEFIERN